MLSSVFSTVRQSIVCPELIDWVSVTLGAGGGLFTLYAAFLGIRTRSVKSETKEAQWVQGGPEIISELDRVIHDLRQGSWVVFFTSLAVIAGVAIQIVQLVERC